MSDGPRHGANFNEDDYARPNQPFRCGWADEGHACPLGPTKWGFCRSAHECAPYKQGDTWVCARTKAYGGPCEEGPLPDGMCCAPIQRCQPVRNVLSRRGLVSLCVFALAAGVGFIMLGSRGRSDLVSPGDLSAQHRQVVQRCQDCHVAGDGELSDWLHVSLDGKAAQQQSQLCLACHRDHGDHALQPHGSSARTLAALTSVSESDTDRASADLLVKVAKSIFGSPTDTHAPLACATCHKEHHGAGALTELTNQQCQVCHASSFVSFSNGHPEFDNYIHKRRSRIYFDHVSHYGQHFAQSRGQSLAATTSESSGYTCKACHLADSSGRYMLVRDFDQSCASCHQQQIEDDSTPGLTFMALPALDLATLREKQIDIGYWPESYPLHVEAAGQLTPASKLLMLNSDEFLVANLAARGLDLTDLSGASEDQLQAVGKLVWLFKEMLHDSSTGGHPELQRRLTEAFGSSVPEAKAVALANAIPVDLFVAMQRRWLPNLPAELRARRDGSQFELDAAPPLAEPAEAIAAERSQLANVRSGWYLHPSSLALRYRPSGHADALLKTLLDITAGSLPTVAAAGEEMATDVLRDAYRQLSSPFAAGRCTKCHSVDSVVGQQHVNWQPYAPPLDRHDFTKFSHAPHVTLLKDQACAACHELSTSQNAGDSLYRPEFHDSNWMPATNPGVFESNFSPLLRTGCVQCHAEQTSRDSCLTCHNYHVR